MQSLLSLALAVTTISTALGAGCNGDVRLCDRPYANVTQIGAHDSPFVGTTPFDDEGISVTDQLNVGIRFLQGQTHLLLGEVTESLGLWMCHTACFLRNAGTLVDYLSAIVSWLEGNPNEILTLLLVNGDEVPVSMFGDAFVSAGLDKYAYVTPGNLSIYEWPTLQELIDSGRRLVTFLDTGANSTVVPYIIDEFTYVYETPFDTTDPTFPECTLDRPPGGTATGRVGLINHFLDYEFLGLGIFFPNISALPVTNSPESIKAQANLCLENFGREITFVLLDNVQVGKWSQAQKDLNHLS